MQYSIGAILNCRGKDFDFHHAFSEAKEMGLSSCQISIWDPTLYTDENAEAINNACAALDFRVSCLFAGYTGPCEWNLTNGPDTIGLVPKKFREMRLGQLIEASEFAEKIGMTDIATHVGFIPEDPSSAEYRDLINSLRRLCCIYKERKQNFLFETGQETPITLLRTIEDIGTENTFVNFDTANLMLYGKGTPVDAIRILGKYVRNTHIKDGFYPTDSKHLGREAKAGEGLADLPLILRILKDFGYTGPYTIEREITGKRQRTDIMDTVAYLKRILSTL